MVDNSWFQAYTNKIHGHHREPSYIRSQGKSILTVPGVCHRSLLFCSQSATPPAQTAVFPSHTVSPNISQTAPQQGQYDTRSRTRQSSHQWNSRHRARGWNNGRGSCQIAYSNSEWSCSVEGTSDWWVKQNLSKCLLSLTVFRKPSQRFVALRLRPERRLTYMQSSSVARFSQSCECRRRAER
jgi:hypothetical protein